MDLPNYNFGTGKNKQYRKVFYFYWKRSFCVNTFNRYFSRGQFHQTLCEYNVKLLKDSIVVKSNISCAFLTLLDLFSYFKTWYYEFLLLMSYKETSSLWAFVENICFSFNKIRKKIFRHWIVSADISSSIWQLCLRRVSLPISQN